MLSADLYLRYQYDYHEQTSNNTNQTTAKKTGRLYAVFNTTLLVH